MKKSKEGNAMNVEEITRRLQVLEDSEAIKKLKVRYCAYCDNNYRLVATLSRRGKGLRS